MKQTDHRIRVTKMLIRRAFTDLLSRKPIQSISVKELCALAGINRGTFYAHYTDIYDLQEKLEDEMTLDFQKALDPLLHSGKEKPTPLAITAGIFKCLKENMDICTMTLGPYGDKEFASRLINLGRESYIESYSRLFSGATSRQLEYYYAFVSAGCIGLLEKWLADGMTDSAEELAATAEGIMSHGIRFLKAPAL